ncbi:MAG: translation initiation factor [Bacteroidia bacterium]
MAKKNKGGLIYSTNPDFDLDHEEKPVETPVPSAQQLKVSRSSKGRGGKIVTLIEGFRGSDEALKDLGKMLKNKAGTGGSAKDGEIIIQGDHREKVGEILKAEGYKVKFSGG